MCTCIFGTVGTLPALWFSWCSEVAGESVPISELCKMAAAARNGLPRVCPKTGEYEEIHFVEIEEEEMKIEFETCR